MLNLYYDKIANWQDICTVPEMENGEYTGRRVEHPFNIVMGMFMIHTGIQKLTRENAPDFYMRAKLVEACTGSMYTYGDGTRYYLTTEDVAKYIGLASNVSTYSEAQFFAHLRKNVVRALRETMQMALREQDKQGATA